MIISQKRHLEPEGRPGPVTPKREISRGLSPARAEARPEGASIARRVAAKLLLHPRGKAFPNGRLHAPIPLVNIKTGELAERLRMVGKTLEHNIANSLLTTDVKF
jgi:hypothetical protein